jgi:hypothetical protein
MAALIYSGCARAAFDNPPALELEAAPLAVGAEELQADYSFDAETADLIYKDRPVTLRGLKIENVQAWFYSGSGYAFSVPTYIKGPQDYFITAGKIKMIPRDPAYLVGAAPGSIVDIVGRCQGLINGEIVIAECWVKITGGVIDTGGGY